MAVVMQMTWSGVTTGQYDAARKVIGMDTTPLAGCLSHVAWQQDGALRVVDVWESEQAWTTYLHDRLLPGIHQVGTLQGQPQVTVQPAHATLFGAQPALK